MTINAQRSAAGIPDILDLTPGPEEYRNIAMVFADSIIGDVHKARKEASRKLLASLVDQVAYLGKLNRGDLIASIVKHIDR